MGSNLRRSRFVELFKSAERIAPTRLSCLEQTAFCDSVAVRPWCAPKTWRLATRLSLLGPVLRPLPEFVHAVFHLADAVGDLPLREHRLRIRKTAHDKARQDATEDCADEKLFLHHCTSRESHFASGRWPEFSTTTRMFLALASSVVCAV